MLTKVLSVIGMVSSAFTTIAQAMIRVNANREIKEVNQVAARWQFGKMVQKPGSSNDKTDLTKKMSHAKSAYIVGLMHYTFLDAVLSANALAADEYDKQSVKMMAIQLVVNVIICIYYGSFVRGVAIICAYMTSYVTKEYRLTVKIISVIAVTPVLYKMISIANIILYKFSPLPRTVVRKMIPIIEVLSLLIIMLTKSF